MVHIASSGGVNPHRWMETMASQRLDAATRGPWAMKTVAPIRLSARGAPARYRLAVMGTSVADVIRSAGGWLCDRAMSGWDVTVLVSGHPDDRPLRVLGAAMLDLESALTTTIAEPLPHTLVVAADLYRHDARVRDVVAKAIDRKLTEVVVWGENWPAELSGRTCIAQHRLSAAARSFKAHALTAASLPCEVIPYELFHRGDLLAYLPGAPDLMPVG
jgi:hypothetical protein